MRGRKVSLTLHDGSIYIGDANNNIPNGKGVMTFSNHDIYDGDWSDGKMDGCGRYQFFDVESDKHTASYVGEFKDNQFNGFGERKFMDKSIYKGQWQNGMRTGNGAMWFSDGSYCFGIWKYDRMIKGIIHLSSGDIYDGELSDGYFEGYGKYHWLKTGDFFEGIFKDGKPFTGNKILRNGNIILYKKGVPFEQQNYI